MSIDHASRNLYFVDYAGDYIGVISLDADKPNQYASFPSHDLHDLTNLVVGGTIGSVTWFVVMVFVTNAAITRRKRVAIHKAPFFVFFLHSAKVRSRTLLTTNKLYNLYESRLETIHVKLKYE